MNNVKVLLVQPNFKYFPGWLDNILNYREIPLGLASIAAYSRLRRAAEVTVCDASFLNWSEGQVIDKIRQVKPQVLGFATHTPTVDFVRNVAETVKKMMPDTHIVLGGPHVTVLPYENLDIADVCVKGEGEQTFVELLDYVQGKRALDTVAGISFKENGRCKQTPDRSFIESLDEIPFPARDLFPRHRYRHIYPYRLKTPYYNTIMTSRGCAFGCNFCSNEVLWKKRVRYRSLENVFLEIEELVHYFDTSLLFIRDDNFTAHRIRLQAFCEKKRQLFPELKWLCHARADCLDEEVLNEMKRAGCVEVQVGVESGDDEVLQRSNKQTSVAAIENAARLLKKAHINFWATFIIGNEGDTPERIERTISFARKISPTYATFLFLVPFPGTQCGKSFLEKGYISTRDWKLYGFHSEPVFETEYLSRDKMLTLRKKAYRSFYLRPSLLIKYLYAFVSSYQWESMIFNCCIVFKFVLGLIRKWSSCCRLILKNSEV